MKKNLPQCALCKTKVCYAQKMQGAEYPAGCPSVADMQEYINEYKSDKNYDFMKAACAAGADKVPRLLEIVQLCKGIEYKRIGIAFCSVLRDQAVLLHEYLTGHGFEVVSVMCKVGGMPKDIIGIPNGKFGLCNPLAQAKHLNAGETDFNIFVGLCTGHQYIAIRNSIETPFDVITRDKVHENCPLKELGESGKLFNVN